MAKAKKSASNGTGKKELTSRKKAAPAKKSAFRVPVKKTAKPPASNKKISDLEERVRTLEKILEAREESTATVEYEVKLFGGAGQIQFKGENLNRVETGTAKFEIVQTTGKQRVQVGGTAPTGDNGRIEVQVKQGSDIISSFANNIYKSGLFLDMIFYTVK